MTNTNFDVIIIGAGPAGSACAIALAGAGQRVALIDRASFPRDKTCGDGLNIDVVNQLALMDPELAAAFARQQGKLASYGIKVFSADHSSLPMPLYHKGVKSCGYVMPRHDFDNFMYSYAKALPHVTYFENCTVQHLEQHSSGVTITAGQLQLQASLLVGADGAHSVVAKMLAGHTTDRRHHSAGLRQYYEGVTGFEADNMIELHFFKETVPGYFWIFPLPGGRANVGVGINSAVIAKKKINLRQLMQQLITTHPGLVNRFSNARPLEQVKGFGLPLGGKKRSLSGNRFLLVGDAASLIDPFTGEGIGNAVRSGRIAAAHIRKCFAAGDFSAAFNRGYDRAVYDKMWKEFRISRLLLRLAAMPRLCSFIIRRANSAVYIRQRLLEALADLNKRGSLLRSPLFYLRLLFPGRQKKAGQA